MCGQKVSVFEKAEIISKFAYKITLLDFSDMK